MEEKKILFDRVSKMFILFGILIFITYFMVRLYAIYRDGAGEFYGVGLFYPDRFLLITGISLFLVFFGTAIYHVNKRYTKSKN